MLHLLGNIPRSALAANSGLIYLGNGSMFILHTG